MKLHLISSLLILCKYISYNVYVRQSKIREINLQYLKPGFTEFYVKRLQKNVFSQFLG